MPGIELKTLDQALDDQVGDAAEVAGEAAQEAAEHEADDHAHQSDGQADPAARQDSGDQVPAQLVGAQQEHAPLPGIEQVQIGVDHAPETVRLTPHQEAHRVGHRPVLHELALEGLHVHPAGHGVDERRSQPAVGVDHADARRRRVHESFVLGQRSVGRAELVGERHQVGQQQNDAGDDRHAVPAELAPHQLPLRGDEVALLGAGGLGAGAGHGSRVARHVSPCARR